MTLIFLAVMSSAVMFNALETKAEENPSTVVLRYQLIEGETRQYRYTMTIADGNALNAELVMNLAVTVVRVNVDGFAAVKVKPSLVSFKAKTEKRTVELVPAQGTATPNPGSFEELVLDVLDDIFYGTTGLQVNPFGQTRGGEAGEASVWLRGLENCPELFCALHSIFVSGGPNPRVLPFWANYSDRPLSLGDFWEVTSDPEHRFEALDLKWTLKGYDEGKAVIEQLPAEYGLYLSFGKNWMETITMHGNSDLRKGFHAPGPVVRQEKCRSGATLSVDLATGWIARYESTRRASGQMTDKNAGLFVKKSRTIDSTVTTLIELL